MRRLNCPGFTFMAVNGVSEILNDCCCTVTAKSRRQVDEDQWLLTSIWRMNRCAVRPPRISAELEKLIPAVFVHSEAHRGRARGRLVLLYLKWHSGTVTDLQAGPAPISASCRSPMRICSLRQQPCASSAMALKSSSLLQSVALRGIVPAPGQCGKRCRSTGNVTPSA